MKTDEKSAKICKNLKKALDKFERICYNIKVDAKASTPFSRKIAGYNP